MLTRFPLRWNWNGGPAAIQGRAVDANGYVQPAVADITKVRGVTGFMQHHNGVFSWSVSADGEVKYALV